VEQERLSVSQVRPQLLLSVPSASIALVPTRPCVVPMSPAALRAGPRDPCRLYEVGTTLPTTGTYWGLEFGSEFWLETFFEAVPRTPHPTLG
jgi:hypothetical protein